MNVWLVITRGDSYNPMPIGICRNPELTLAALRSAWSELQDTVRSYPDHPAVADGAGDAELCRIEKTIANLEPGLGRTEET